TASECVARKRSRNLIDNQANRKDTPQPKANTPMSAAFNKCQLLYTSYSAAADTMGTAARKEYSAAASRVKPSSIPPTMVEDERDIPGHKARHWKHPMPKACLKFTESADDARGRWERPSQNSAASIKRAPKAKPIATVAGLNRRSLMAEWASLPSTNPGAVVTANKANPRQPESPPPLPGGTKE